VLEIKELIEHFESGAIGEVVKTQTTYLDIICKFQPESSQSQNKFRIHFRGKREFLLDKGKFTQLQLFDKHPLLIDYIDPVVPIHLASAVTDKQKFREELEFVTNQFFNGWRSFEEYLNMPLDKFLEKSYGILMSAPQTFAEAVVQMAERNGIKLIVHKYDKDETIKPSVILFDKYYVIADEFKYEILE
jgi:hypothetical protein